MNIPEEMFLLAHRPDGRLMRLGMRDGVAYTMTAIVELALKDKVTIEEGKNPRLRVRNAQPTGDPVLDHTLNRLASQRDGERLARCIIDKHADPKSEIIDRLRRQGVIERHSGGFMSLGSSTYPLREAQERDRIVARLAKTLNGNGPHAPVEDAALLAALRGLESLPRC